MLPRQYAAQVFSLLEPDQDAECTSDRSRFHWVRLLPRGPHPGAGEVDDRGRTKTIVTIDNSTVRVTPEQECKVKKALHSCSLTQPMCCQFLAIAKGARVQKNATPRSLPMVTSYGAEWNPQTPCFFEPGRQQPWPDRPPAMVHSGVREPFRSKCVSSYLSNTPWNHFRGSSGGETNPQTPPTAPRCYPILHRLNHAARPFPRRT
jgi:hypothetical protein